MGEELRLDGSIVPRRVRRMFDQRAEARVSVPASAELEWRGAAREINLINISASGAMIECDDIPHIGERVTLTLAGEAPAQALVRWVRDGRIGLHFAASVG